MQPPVPSLRPETVARVAYQLWEAEGRQEGMDEAYWFEAEKSLADVLALPPTFDSDAVPSAG